MPTPAMLVVVADAPGRATIERDLVHRFGRDYRVTGAPSGEAAKDQLDALKDGGDEVAMLIVDTWLPGMSGLELLAAGTDVHPAAKRILLHDFMDPTTLDPILEGTAFGLFDRVLAKQGHPAEEWLYPAVSELLAEWSRSTPRPRFEAAQVIGSPWAARCAECRNLLGRNGVPYGFYDVESDEGQCLLAEASQDGSRLPVVVLHDGRVLVDPTNDDIAAALGMRTHPGPGPYDVVIVGAGPAGLSTAVYAASEGLQTLVLEPEAVGGQAGSSPLIRNYFGFGEGVSGARLTQAAARQATFFGADIVIHEAAVGLRAERGDRVVSLADGTDVRCKAVVIATGVSYRRLAIPGLDALVGAGVFYGPATSETRGLRGQPTIVVGGGNSAGQAALHLCRHAEQVTLVHRGDSLAASMSDYLVKEIEIADNVYVRLNTEVVDGGGTGRLQWVVLRNEAVGVKETVPAAALFVLIGAEPRTDWLAGTVARDPGGYVLTGSDLGDDGRPKGWPLQRGPFLVETSLPGVFAVGDVRHGATRRVATAVGEGALAVRFVHEYLAERAAVREVGPNAGARTGRDTPINSTATPEVTVVGNTAS